MTITFGQFLRSLRVKRNLTQGELTHLCGKKGKGEYIGEYERDERHPAWSTILLFAGALGLTMGDEDTVKLLNLAGYTEADTSVFLLSVNGTTPENALPAGLRSLAMELSLVDLNASIAADLAHGYGYDQTTTARLSQFAGELKRLSKDFEDLIHGVKPISLN